MEREIRLRNPIWMNLLGVIVTCLMIFLGVFILANNGDFWMNLVALFLVGMGIFLGFDIFVTEVLHTRKIRLSNEGLSDISVYRTKFFPWHRIKHINTFSQSHNRFLGLVGKEKKTRVDSFTSFLSLLYGSHYSLRIPLVMLKPSDVDEIFDLFEKNMVVEEVQTQTKMPESHSSKSDLGALSLTIFSAVVLITMNEVAIQIFSSNWVVFGSIGLMLFGYYFYSYRSENGLNLQNRLIVTLTLALYSVLSLFVDLLTRAILYQGVSASIANIGVVIANTLAAHLEWKSNGLYYLFTTVILPLIFFTSFFERKKKAP